MALAEGRKRLIEQEEQSEKPSGVEGRRTDPTKTQEEERNDFFVPLISNLGFGLFSKGPKEVFGNFPRSKKLSF